MPGSIEEALDNLKKDHEFLLKGDVFTEDVVETWIEYKFANETGARGGLEERGGEVLRLLREPFLLASYLPWGSTPTASASAPEP